MGDDQNTTALEVRKDWVRTTLIPSITSASIGGALLGCFCGWLFAPSHLLLEAVLGSALIGAIVGFVIAWLGSAVVGLLGSLFK